MARRECRHEIVHPMYLPSCGRPDGGSFEYRIGKVSSRESRGDPMRKAHGNQDNKHDQAAGEQASGRIVAKWDPLTT